MSSAGPGGSSSHLFQTSDSQLPSGKISESEESRGGGDTVSGYGSGHL